MVRTSRDGSTHALNVFNFAATPAQITVDVSRSPGIADQVTTDLLTGDAGPEIRDGTLTVTLPGHGWLFLDVTAARRAPDELIDSGTDDWVTGGGWSEVVG